MTWQPDIMLYHANCADGFGAAWAAWMRWRDTVTYLPVSYGAPPPDVAGKDVLIGDFSYKAPQLAEMAGSANSIIVLDHHKTAQADLVAFTCRESSPGAVVADDALGMFEDLRELRMPPVIALFDMNRSGAGMVWDFCFPGETRPLLIDLIEDRDLWLFRHEDTKPFGLWLRSEPFDFERWELIAQELNDGRDGHAIMTEARAMQRFFDQKVSEIAAMFRWGNVGGHHVPICNCPPMFASEVGHKLLDDEPGAEFVALYSDQGKSRGYSLRSRDDRADVSAIARKFGGGGHRNAAGFGVPLP